LGYEREYRRHRFQSGGGRADRHLAATRAV
jgi:hypothetical protein